MLIACEVISRWGHLPRIETTEDIPAGQRITLKLPAGFTAAAIEESAEALAATTMGVREVRVVRDPADASLSRVSIVVRDPLSAPAPPWRTPAGSLWDPFPLGIDEDGNPVSIMLVERNVLLGGEPGSGKSAALSLFIAAAALDPWVQLTLLDGKQVELAPWSGSAQHFVGPVMADAIEVLKDLCAEMDRRYSLLLGSGLRKIERGIVGFGLHVVAVDELAFYMQRGDQRRAHGAHRDAARPDLAGACRGDHRHRSDPEALQRHHPDLRAGPLLVPHGAALHHPGGLRHHPRTGLGQRGLLGLHPGSDCSRCGLPARRRGGPGQDAHPLPRRHRRRPVGQVGRFEEVAVMTSGAHWRALLAEVDQAGLCSNPVRLRGLTLDRTTGELRDGSLLVPCKDRRASVCASCSRLYAKDAWHLVAAGIRGGKGVDPTVARHPQLFVTLTAPTFGPVHAPVLSKPSVKPCRPRRAQICGHGRSLSCVERHQEGSDLLGEPLCVECFDYPGAVLWNAHVLPRLWIRTSLLLYRAVAAAGKMPESETRSTLRLSYVKVVEFQRRGLVHLHVVLRADGAAGPGHPPPSWLDAEVLDAAVREAAFAAYVAVPVTPGTALRRASWGGRIDVRHLPGDSSAEPTAIAAYIAKYATKTVDGTAQLAHPVRSVAHLKRLGLRPHLASLVRTAWTLGSRPELRQLALRAHAHTLGYGGQFSSKSRLYSTTFAALRDARACFARGDGEDDIDFDGEWHFGGRGYAHPDTAGLAEALATVRRVPKGVPGPVPKGVPRP